MVMIYVRSNCDLHTHKKKWTIVIWGGRRLINQFCEKNLAIIKSISWKQPCLLTETWTVLNPTPRSLQLNPNWPLKHLKSPNHLSPVAVLATVTRHRTFNSGSLLQDGRFPYLWKSIQSLSSPSALSGTTSMIHCWLQYLDSCLDSWTSASRRTWIDGKASSVGRTFCIMYI